MVIVLSFEDIDMEGRARGDGEGVEDVGDHLRGELADLFALKAELGDAVGTRADVDDGSGECLCDRVRRLFDLRGTLGREGRKPLRLR